MEEVPLAVAAGPIREGGQGVVEAVVVVVVVVAAEERGCRLDMAALHEDEHAVYDTTYLVQY